MSFVFCLLAGAAYSLTDSIDLFGSVLRTVAARNGHVLSHNISVGASFSFGRRKNAAWHLRNGVTTGYWGFSTQFDRAIFYSAGAGIAAIQKGVTYVGAYEAITAELNNDLGPATSGTQASAMRERGARLIRAHPGAFASSYLMGAGATVLHPGTGAFMRLFGAVTDDPYAESATRSLILWRWRDARALLMRKGVVYWLVTIPLFVVNLTYLTLFVRGFRQWRYSPFVLVASVMVAYFLVVSGGPGAESRRRTPMVPALCLVGGQGLLAVMERRRSRPFRLQ